MTGAPITMMMKVDAVLDRLRMQRSRNYWRTIPMMTNEMPPWWFAGELLGATLLANDETASSVVRETMRRRLDDLLANWSIADKQCRRLGSPWTTGIGLALL